MPKSLQSRKRQLVRDAIYDAAIELFAEKGFDDTTVEEVAEAAGISRRSFFRYFESKDDLLALNTVICGEILRETVESCPGNRDSLEVVSETVLAGMRFTEAQERTRQIIEIAAGSASARQAHLSRLMEVEDRLASAFSVRLKSPSRDLMKPRLLAGLCQLVINTATASWFLGESKDLPTAANQAFHSLTKLFCDESRISMEVPSGKKAPSAKVSKKPRKGRQ